MCICMCVDLCMCMHIHVCIRVYLCVSCILGMYAGGYICMCVCTCVHVCSKSSYSLLSPQKSHMLTISTGSLDMFFIYLHFALCDHLSTPDNHVSFSLLCIEVDILDSTWKWAQEARFSCLHWFIYNNILQGHPCHGNCRSPFQRLNNVSLRINTSCFSSHGLEGTQAISVSWILRVML